MKYTIVYETTSTHESTVELDDDYFEDSSTWTEVPECDGSTNFSQVEECKAIYITNDKGEEVWQI
jgi:hypothetical protein